MDGQTSESRIGERFGAILFNLTEKCNLRCRHCGYGESSRKGQMTADEIRSWAIQVLEAGIPHITFTGGEPFTQFELLRGATEFIHRHGGTSGVFTSGYFGASEAAATEKLTRLQGLTKLYVSSDIYHWDYVEPEKSMNVVRAASALGIESIIVCVTYSEESERHQIEERLAPIKDHVRFYFSRVIRTAFVGRLVPNASSGSKALCPGNFKSSCHLHTPLLNPTGTLTICHVGKEETHGHYHESPYVLGNLKNESLQEILSRAEDNLVYEYLWCHGPRGVADAALAADEKLADCSFTSDCEMCCKLLPLPAVREEIEDRSRIARALQAVPSSPK